MQNVTRLDRVSIFSNKLSFLVPHEWRETIAEDHYLYHQTEADSGWLRVTLLISKSVSEDPSQQLAKIFASKNNVFVEEKTGNLVSTSEKDSEEDGVRIHLYYWMVANVVLPNSIYEAVFSYTVLLDRLHDKETQQMVKLIGNLVSQAELSLERPE
jgi:hypothetical protein